MEIDIKASKKEVNELYRSLRPMVDEVVNKHSKTIDDIIKKIKNNLTVLTNKELQDYMMQLSIELYFFSESKDKSILMQECALVLTKETQAEVFNSTSGTQSVRNNQAIINTLDKQAIVMIQNAVANQLKSKLDEGHRIVNILSNILISRNAENKLKGVGNVRSDDNNTCGNSFSENREE